VVACHIEFAYGAGGQGSIPASLIFAITLFEVALGAIKISVNAISSVYQLF
jgi:hypothetical protein